MISWNGKNREIYENLGYKFTKWKDKFEVQIEDLNINSDIKVEVRCDYCGKTIHETYSNFIDHRSKSYVQKDACWDCRSLKMKDNALNKNKDNKLNRNDVGYWQIEENRLKELDNYIKTYVTIDHMRKDKLGYCILNSIWRSNMSVDESVIKLGYKIEDVKTIFSVDMFNTFDKISDCINQYIEKYGRFPTITECNDKLGITQKALKQFGGIHEVKRKMNYNGVNDLKDDRGWYNKSSYEYIVAQFLIHNNVPYKREQRPFPEDEGRYKSDFTFYLEDEIIHCEVWGYYKKHGGYSKIYIKNKNIKKNLYRKYNINYIEIEPDIFRDKYEMIYERLRNIFEKVLGSVHQEFNLEILIPPNKMTDEELLEEIMKYSDDNEYLPSENILRKYHKSSIFNQIIQRYGHIDNFALKFNKKSRSSKAFSIKNYGHNGLFPIYLGFMNRYGEIFTLEEFKQKGIGDLRRYIDHFGGYVQSKLDFYSYCIENKITISQEEIIWLKKFGNNEFKKLYRQITPDRINKANEILNLIN